jgi:hypothetical protein
MSELNRDARAFLANARGAHEPASGAKDRVRAGLVAALSVPAGGAAAAAVVRPPVRASWLTAAKLAALAAVVGAGAVLLFGRDAREPREVREVGETKGAHESVAASPVVRAPSGDIPSPVRGASADLASASPSEPPRAALLASTPGTASGSGWLPAAPSAPSIPVVQVDSLALAPSSSGSPLASDSPAAAAPHAGASAHHRAVAGGSVAAEVAILRRVSAALRAGDAEAALAAVGEHARRFPNGALAEERDTERIVALCALGRRDEGARATERFNRAYPSSSHAARVQAACVAPATP